MKLYYSKGACSLGIRILLHELKLQSEFESVNLKTKQTEKDVDYLTINPKGSVPVLITDNNETLTENTMIQQYLAEMNNATDLFPAIGDIKRYRVLEWLSFVSTDLHKSCGPLFNPTVPEELKEKIFRPLLNSKLVYVDKHLQQNKYLLADQFTLPDTYLFVVLRWMPALQISLEDKPNLTRYMAELKKRKSIEEALKEEGLA